MLGLSCVTRVHSFYCLFPRHRGDVPPSPSPSFPPSFHFHCSNHVFHKLLSLILVLFTAGSFIPMSCSPLLVCSSFPWTLSLPAQAPGIHLLSAHSILHTYVAQDAWWAFLCFFSFDPWLAVPSDARETQIQENIWSPKSREFVRSSRYGLLPFMQNLLNSDCS